MARSSGEKAGRLASAVADDADENLDRLGYERFGPEATSYYARQTRLDTAILASLLSDLLAYARLALLLLAIIAGLIGYALFFR